MSSSSMVLPWCREVAFVLHNSIKKDRKSLAAVTWKKVWASGNPACSVRYYSHRVRRSAIIIPGSAVKIRKESTIVLTDLCSNT